MDVVFYGVTNQVITGGAFLQQNNSKAYGYDTCMSIYVCDLSTLFMKQYHTIYLDDPRHVQLP